MADTLTVISASDSGYACGLAAMLWSARKHLARHVHLDVRVFDGGLSVDDRAALERALQRAGGPAGLTFIAPPPQGELEHKLTRSPLLFARLHVPDVFPELARALLLDADLVVTRDLAPILDVSFHEKPLWAVRDEGVGTLGGPWENLPLAEFGLPADAPYFNAGVMWMDVATWRREGLGRRAMQLWRDKNGRWNAHDQSVLNLLLHGRWGALDGSWNRQLWIGKEVWRVAPPGPALVHYVGEKPWKYPLDRPIGAHRLFARYLRASGWWDHRPPVASRKNPVEDSWLQRVREWRMRCSEARQARSLYKPSRCAPIIDQS